MAPFSTATVRPSKERCLHFSTGQRREQTQCPQTHISPVVPDCASSRVTITNTFLKKWSSGDTCLGQITSFLELVGAGDLHTINISPLLLLHQNYNTKDSKQNQACSCGCSFYICHRNTWKVAWKQNTDKQLEIFAFTWLQQRKQKSGFSTLFTRGHHRIKVTWPKYITNAQVAENVLSQEKSARS